MQEYLTAKKQIWYLDNGCSKHITGDNNKLWYYTSNMKVMSHMGTTTDEESLAEAL